MFLRRLGNHPQNPNASCVGGANCPDVLEMDSGDFAVIGTDITEQARGKLLPGTGCGPEERIVKVPRQTLVSVREHIPSL